MVTNLAIRSITIWPYLRIKSANLILSILSPPFAWFSYAGDHSRRALSRVKGFDLNEGEESEISFR